MEDAVMGQKLFEQVAWVNDDAIAHRLLGAAALWASQVAKAPYSSLCVGAAGLLSDGGLVRGANMESPSYSLIVHAEAAMLVQRQALAVSGSVPALTHVACCTSAGRILAPCGLCRQILVEQAGADVLVAGLDGWVSVGDLLPWHFSDSDLHDDSNRAPGAR